MTSTREEIVLPTSHNTHSELNGDVSVASDAVPSVHNNIFFKTFGRLSKQPAPHRSEGGHDRNGSEADISNEDEIEYRPGSGFVTRLLGKFANLTTKEEKVTPRLKRSSSLEGDATVEIETFKRPLTQRETSKSGLEKQSASITKLTRKAESIECLNHRSRSAFPVSLRHVEIRNNVEKQPKSPRISQEIVAPDADLAREDIVIIENIPVPPLALEDSEDEKVDNVPQILSYRDDAPIEELPKPNTVLNTRSIFESASVGSASSTISVHRHKSDSLSESTASRDKPRNSFTSSSPVTSPRILSYDTPVTPWLSRGNSTEAASSTSSTVVSDMTNNYSKHSSHDDRSRSTSNSDATSSSKESVSYPSVFDRGSRFESGKILDSSRPAPSPRSTASVKPTIVSKPVTSVNVKPIPISTPPSAATSFKKTPVVPVAPFKKQEENVVDDSPVMIYEKPKSPTRKVRPERVKMYDELPSKAVNEKKGEERNDFIIPSESRKIFEKDNESNKNKSEKLSTNNVSEVRTFENNITNNREKTFSFIKPTVNDVVDDNVQQHNNKDSSSVSIAKDRTTISISSNKTQISISNEPGKKLEAKRYKAPVPGKPGLPEKEPIKLNRAPQPPTGKRTTDEKPAQSMIYISSSSETSESESSPPETPRTQPVKVTQRVQIAERTKLPEPIKVPEPVRVPEPIKVPEPVRVPDPVRVPEPVKEQNVVKVPEPESADKPIKGIPSIIAQRLNKQNNSPRDQANFLANTTESESALSQNKEHSVDDRSYSFKDNLESIKNAENGNQQPSKEAISSEIENEIAAVRKKMDSNRSKGSGPAQIFDSSQLAKKRQENKRQRAAAAAAAQGIVPRLDFSSLNEDRSKNERMAQKEIKPCNIKFVGENTKTSRSLLKKQRNVKVNVQFKETISNTFEYLNLEQALEAYLEEHPNERHEQEEEENGILFLDGFSEGGDMGESSDDTDLLGGSAPAKDPQSPRNAEEENLKSNPALSSSGNTLQSYRGRFQEEFVFGSNMSEPESPPKAVVPDLADDPDSMMLRPSEEEDANTWSTNSSSDLLF